MGRFHLYLQHTHFAWPSCNTAVVHLNCCLVSVHLYCRACPQPDIHVNTKPLLFIFWLVSTFLRGPHPPPGPDNCQYFPGGKNRLLLRLVNPSGPRLELSTKSNSTYGDSAPRCTVSGDFIDHGIFQYTFLFMYLLG